MLSEELASAFARVALANSERAYPRAIAHVLRSPDDEVAPTKVHPAFFGSYDWHSAVHMHWLMVRVLRLYPMLPENGRIAALLDGHLSAANLEMELDYVKENPLFERPYGWAWLLELQAEALRMKARWSRSLEPLAVHLAQKTGDFFSQAPYPMRAGSHFNTAFAAILALDYARAAADLPLEMAIRRAARRWYGGDRDAPLAYEPSLDDFLSPVLVEAALMREVLEPAEFARWLNGFFPEGVGTLAEPPAGHDRSDAKQSHLDGLCLSRAWCFTALGLSDLAEKHLAAALPQVVGGDYVGEHWLASFAVLALSSAAIGAARRTP